MSLPDFATAFTLGLLTPLTAVCVLPLYPGFLAYLANLKNSKNFENERKSRKTYALFGLLITLGVIIFMFLLGLIFTTILQVSLTHIIQIISPIAFGILVIISLFLIFDIDFSRFFPKFSAPISKKKNPLLSAFLYGFFFGAIVIPCNPAFIGALFARAFLMTNFSANIIDFIFFGIGIGFPLLAFSLISIQWSQKIISYLSKNKRVINLSTGIIMLGISLYYLIKVFNVLRIF